MTVLHQTIQTALQTAIPDGAWTGSQWAAQRRIVSQERVANPALAGKWKNETTPYLVEILDCFTDSITPESILIKSSQIAGTEAICCAIGYYIDIDPAKMIYCAETEPKARAFGVEALDPMIRDTVQLARKVSPPKSRDALNTMERKVFPGGMLNIVWATSPSQLSSRPARVIMMDEADAYEPTREGNAIDLAEARMKTAGDQKKLLLVTTPRTKETSGVFTRWQNSTQEKYFVPCPHCGEMQVLNWLNEGNVGCVLWSEETGEDAYYRCVNGCYIDHDEKHDMLAKGEWRVTNLEYKGNRRGFWINEIYSPFTTWADMARGWIEANEAKRTLKDTSKLQVFLNTRLAQWWEEDGESIDYQDLGSHIEEYEAEVPDGVLVLAAGVDVQGNRLECEIIGFGRDGESWSIAYFVIEGDPALNAVWEDLFDILSDDYESVNGNLRVAAACVDTGGHHANQVYKFCKANSGRRWFAVKGASTAGKPLISKPTKNNRFGVRLFTVGADTAKDQIFAHLSVNEHGPGFCHFPAEPSKGEPYDVRYLQQLCSEKRVTTFVSGQPKSKYVKVNPKGIESASARNEALDIRVYALAALQILNPNYKMLAKRRDKLPQQVEINSELPEKNDKVTRNNPNPHGVDTYRSGGGWSSNY